MRLVLGRAMTAFVKQSLLEQARQIIDEERDRALGSASARIQYRLEEIADKVDVRFVEEDDNVYRMEFTLEELESLK